MSNIKMDQFQEGHLNSPLLKDAFLCVFSIGYNRLCRNHKSEIDALAQQCGLSGEVFYSTAIYLDINIDYWGVIENIFLRQITSSDARSIYDQIKVILPKIIQLMSHTWYKQVAINEQALRHFIHINETRLLGILRQYHFIGMIKQQIRTTLTNNKLVMILDSRLLYGQNMAVLKYNGKLIVIENKLVLGCLDKLQEEPLLLLVALFDDYFDDNIPGNRFDDISACITELRFLRQVLKNNMCQFLKLFESLIIGWIITLDASYPTTTLWDSTMVDVIELWPSFYESYIYRRLGYFSVTDKGKIYLLATSSIAKVLGHPMVDTQKGYEALMERCSRYKFETIQFSQEIAATLKLILVKAHYVKTQKWPKKHLNENHELFKTLFSLNRWLTQKELKSIPIIRWLEYDLTGLFELNLDIPLHDMISDKALAPRRDEWHKAFDQCTLVNSNIRKPRGFKSYSRVLEEYLNIEDPDYIRNVVTNFDLTGMVPFLDRIFVLNPKELEEKIEGRMFCKQTHWVRTIQTVSEKNLSDGVLRDMNSQTMSLSGLDVDHKLSSIASLYQSSQNPDTDYHIVYFNVDFSKWNTSFTFENTAMVFAVFDELYGTTRLFQSTHLLYQSCLVIFCNRTNTTIILDKDGEPTLGYGGYKHHRAGFEGMRQKGWTIITQTIVEWHAFVNNFVISLIGQGDNQVIALRVKGKTLNMEYVQAYFNTLIDAFARMGLPVKEDETYVSSELFSYGRQHFYKGSEVPSTYKKVRRGFPDGNDSYISLDADLCTIMTSMESGARSSNQPFTSICLAVIIHIDSFSRYHLLDLLNNDDILITLLHHHNLGGASQLGMVGFFIRGHEDPITSSLNLLLHAIKCMFCGLSNLDWEKYLNCRTQVDTDYQVLLESPNSINIFKMSTPKKWMREKANTYIEKVSKNPEINNWINMTTDVDKENLIATLMTVNPLMLTLVSEIWRCSVPGVKDSMAAKLTNTKTIIRYVQTEEPEVIQRLIANFENEIAEKRTYFEGKRQGDINLYSELLRFDCSYQLAQYLRVTTWKKDIKGITVPTPNELWVSDDDTIRGRRSIKLWGFINVKYDTMDPEKLTLRGKYKPYHGGTTKEKLFQNSSMDLEVKNMSSEIRRGVSLAGWLDNEKYKKLQKIVLNTLAQLLEIKGCDMDQLMNVYRLEGGTMDHRLHSAYYSKTISSNSTLNISTHTSVSTNTLSDAIKGQDWTIVYQSVILWATSIGILLQVNNPKINRIITIDCEGCLNPIVSHTITVDDSTTNHIVLKKGKVRLSPCHTREDPTYLFSMCLGAILGKEERNHHSVFITQNSLEVTLSQNNKPVINLNDLRKCDMSVFLTSLFIHSSLPKILDYININLPPPSLAMFEITAHHIIQAGLVRRLVKTTKIPMQKHGLSTDINKLSQYITHCLIMNVSNMKIDYLTDTMQDHILYQILDRSQSSYPLYPLSLFIHHTYPPRETRKEKILRTMREGAENVQSNKGETGERIGIHQSKSQKEKGDIVIKDETMLKRKVEEQKEKEKEKIDKSMEKVETSGLGGNTEGDINTCEKDKIEDLGSKNYNSTEGRKGMKHLENECISQGSDVMNDVDKKVVNTTDLTITHSTRLVKGTPKVRIETYGRKPKEDEIIKYIIGNITTVSCGPVISQKSSVVEEKHLRIKLNVPKETHPMEFLSDNRDIDLPSHLTIIYDAKEVISKMRDSVYLSKSEKAHTLTRSYNYKKDDLCISVPSTQNQNYTEPIDKKRFFKIHHKSRMLVKSTSAASKYFEILASYSPPSSGCIVTLAEGAGSVCSLLCHMYPKRKYFFNTLKSEENVNSQDLMSMQCPESLLIDECLFTPVSSRIEFDSTGDLTEEKTWESIKSSLNDEPIGIITMDAESLGGDVHSDILGKLSTYLYKLNIVGGSILIIKLLLDGLFEHANRTIYLPLSDYQIVKPPSSNPGNKEFFLVGTMNISCKIRINYLKIFNLGSSVIYQSRWMINYKENLMRSLKRQKAFIEIEHCFNPKHYILQELGISREGNCVCEAISLAAEYFRGIGESYKFKDLLDYDPSLQHSNEILSLHNLKDKINDILIINALQSTITKIEDQLTSISIVGGYYVRKNLKRELNVFKQNVMYEVNLTDKGLKLFWKIIGYKYLTCNHFTKL